jgi:DNA-binding FrmR family transcriptional regulator
MDDGRIGDEMTLAGIAKQLEKIQSDITAVQSDIAAVRSDIKTVDGKVDSLDHKMTVEFEATRGLINLGFENVQMLDEKMDRRFDEAERANAGHRSVLEAAIVGLGRDTTARRD